MRLSFRWCCWLAIAGSAVGTASGQDANDLDTLRKQLQEMQRRFEQSEQEHRRQMEEISAKLRELENAGTNTAATAPPPTNSAAGTGLWSGRLASPRGNAYVDIGLVGTLAVGTSTADDIADSLELGGHDPNQRGFTLQGIELNLSGAVDPYFRGSANLLFGLDSSNDSYFELEEGWLETSSLPWGLQLRAGQIMTQFGRQNPQHLHAWDFVDTPLVLGRLLGPDGLRNPGVQLSWLMPTPFFSELLMTIQDSQGAGAYSFRFSGEHDHGGGGSSEPPFSYRDADNDRGVVHFQDLLLTPRYAVSFDLTDSQTVLLGTSAAFGPNSRGGEGSGDTWTQIYGLDLTWKWKSPSHHGGFPFVTFQAEGLLRRAQVGAFDWSTSGDDEVVIDDTTGLPADLAGETLRDYGFYSQIVYGFTKGWAAGLRGDYVSSNVAAYEQRSLSYGSEELGRDPQRARRWRISPNLTWYPTEFSRIRLQYNLDDRQDIGVDHSVWFQMEFSLGAHAAHQF